MKTDWWEKLRQGDVECSKKSLFIFSFHVWFFIFMLFIWKHTFYSLLSSRHLYEWLDGMIRTLWCQDLRVYIYIYMCVRFPLHRIPNYSHALHFLYAKGLRPRPLSYLKNFSFCWKDYYVAKFFSIGDWGIHCVLQFDRKKVFCDIIVLLNWGPRYEKRIEWKAFKR